MHVNKINGKRYVGITSKKPEYRWNNGKNYKGCTYFSRAIDKYGWDNFENIIVHKNLDVNEAKRIETMLILKYKTNDGDHGYNLNTGGHLMIPCADTRKRMSESAKGRIFSKSHRLKIGVANSKRVLSSNSRDKISSKMMGRMLNGSNPNAKCVINLNTLEVFDTFRNAAKKHNISETTISGNCRKVYKSAGGFKWLYYDEYLKMSIEEVEKVLNEPLGVSGSENAYNRKKLINLNTLEVFNTMKDAAKKYNLCPSSLSKCCKGKVKKCGGYEWSYLEQYEKVNSI